MLEKDKLLHFIVCETIAIIVAFICLLCRFGNFAFPVAFVVSLGAGIGKEIYDKKKTGLYDKMDVVFDFFGAFAGMVFSYMISFAV